MQWLLHGGLTAAVGRALARHGHVPHAAADAGLPGDAAPGHVLQTALARQWDLITDDAALAHAPFDWPVPFTRCMVYLQLPGGDVEQDDAIDRLFRRYQRLGPQRLYTVTETRVKIRQLPTRKPETRMANQTRSPNDE